MSKFVDLFTNWALVGLVVIGILFFATTFESENHVPSNFIEDDPMSQAYSDLQTHLGNLSTQSQAQKTLFESDTPTGGIGELLLFSILSAGKVFNGMIVGTFNILIKLPATYLGVDPFIFSVISTILIILIILGLWQIYKVGG